MCNCGAEKVILWFAIDIFLAFVEFESPRDAEDAVRGLDGRTICGRRARVEVSSGKSGRGFRGGPSRSGAGGRGRHNSGKFIELA